MGKDGENFMLRVGLTGGLGSGKSAIAAVFAEGGAHVFSADEIGRSLMQPGEQVYAEIVDHFGPEVVGPDGQLNRNALARLAFDGGRLQELNAIVHPAVLRAQSDLLDQAARKDPFGIAVVESALIFEVARELVRAGLGPSTAGTDWRSRFDRVVLVTAPEEVKIARYVARVAPPAATPDTRARLAADARSRLAAQIPDSEKMPLCDFVIENTQTLVLLRRRAQAVLAALRDQAASSARPRRAVR
jgi:dephospho-CoA kinase